MRGYYKQLILKWGRVINLVLARIFIVAGAVVMAMADQDQIAKAGGQRNARFAIGAPFTPKALRFGALGKNVLDSVIDRISVHRAGLKLVIEAKEQSPTGLNVARVQVPEIVGNCPKFLAARLIKFGRPGRLSSSRAADRLALRIGGDPQKSVRWKWRQWVAITTFATVLSKAPRLERS